MQRSANTVAHKAQTPKQPASKQPRDLKPRLLNLEPQTLHVSLILNLAPPM